jgi:hypothetical protein
MNVSYSSRRTAAIQAKDVSLVINTPEEADFWDAMYDLGILHEFFKVDQPLTLEQVFARERARELSKKASTGV